MMNWGDKMKKLWLISLGLIVLVFVAGFRSDVVKNVTDFIAEKAEIKIGWVEFSNLNSIKCSYTTFTGIEKRGVWVKAHQCILLSYKVTVSSGNLQIRIESPSGIILWQNLFESDESGVVNIKANQSGWYEVFIEGENTRGSFDIRWKVK